MDLDSFIITMFCHIEDALKECFGKNAWRDLRRRGPSPILADSEVLTMEAVGEYLGLRQDKAIFDYFRRHYCHFFPALSRLHRTTFTRQGANLWLVKERLWGYFLMLTHHDEELALVDSFPLPVCRFARARQCKRLREVSAFGKDVIARQTFYGMRVHARVCWPGVITRLELAPANASELSVLPDLTEQTTGTVLGDRNYWSPRTKEELSQKGVMLIAPFRSARRDLTPQPTKVSLVFSRVRYRIDTVFGQLVERYSIKRLWARDLWHLSSRLLRQVLSHTLCFLLNQLLGKQPLQFAQLVVE
jgi:hypothetical protein